MKKIVIFLCLIMSLLTVFASCKKGGNSTEPGSDNNDKIVEYSGELAVNTEALKQFDKTFNENHVFSYKATGTYIVKNGKTSYKVVVPEVETEAVSYAKSELSRFFQGSDGHRSQIH